MVMKYRYIKQIGQGGFGIVDEVEDEVGNRWARKTFHIFQENAFSEAYQNTLKKRFNREAETQQTYSQLTPHIVKVIDAFPDADPPYYIMPLADSSLENDIEQNKNLGGEFINALSDIMAGVAFLHDNGLFHRDLKPSNVLRFGNLYAIADFGLVSFGENKKTRLTESGVANKNRDNYTAPEILNDLKKAGKQSDIFSLGCILHDFVGKRNRTPGSTIKERHKWGNIMQICTETDPQKRFKNVADLREEIFATDKTLFSATDDIVQNYASILTKNKPEKITSKQWREIVNYIEAGQDVTEDDSLLELLSSEHISYLINNYDDIANSLGKTYATWIKESRFRFSACDGLAVRLLQFYDGCEMDVKIDCLMALLIMGTSHNRWFVENQFVRKVSKKMDDSIARRLAVQFSAEREIVCPAIEHLKESINFSVDNLHPFLSEKIADICR